MPTGRQIRAARSLINWDAAHLAQKAGVRRETILAIENGLTRPRASTIDNIVQVFNDSGVEFRGESGVELRNDTVRLLEGNDAYLKLLDDVYLTLGDGGEALFAFVSNRLSPTYVIDKQLLLRKKGIKFRALIEDGDTYCLYPLNEYRAIPKSRFHNNTQIIYGNKVGAMVTDRQKLAIVIRNKIFSDTQRSMFEMLWDVCRPPAKTTAEVSYD